MDYRVISHLGRRKGDASRCADITSMERGLLQVLESNIIGRRSGIIFAFVKAV